MTRVGIANAVPVWMKTAAHDVQAAIRIAHTRMGMAQPGIVAQPAFNAVFFATMAWCLTQRVSVVRRRDLPTTIERHLIEPGGLDPRWRGRVKTLWSAWKAENAWHPDTDAKPTISEARDWAETAREFRAVAAEAIETAGVELKDESDPPDECRPADREGRNRPCSESRSTNGAAPDDGSR